MITKIHTSRNIAATVSYVLNPKKRAEILLSKGLFSLAGAENITREFEMQSALRPEAKTKLLHIPMSFHVRDRDLMERDGQAIVREWLHRMEACGFHFDQYIVVRHHDQDLLYREICEAGVDGGNAQLGDGGNRQSDAVPGVENRTA